MCHSAKIFPKFSRKYEIKITRNSAEFRFAKFSWPPYYRCLGVAEINTNYRMQSKSLCVLKFTCKLIQRQLTSVMGIYVSSGKDKTLVPVQYVYICGVRIGWKGLGDQHLLRKWISIGNLNLLMHFPRKQQKGGGEGHQTCRQLPLFLWLFRASTAGV
jgi:hypothetical protein